MFFTWQLAMFALTFKRSECLQDPKGVEKMKNKLLRLPEVLNATGLKRTTFYAMVSRGEFAKPVRLSTRSVAWTERDVEGWIESRIKIQKETAAS